MIGPDASCSLLYIYSLYFYFFLDIFIVLNYSSLRCSTWEVSFCSVICDLLSQSKELVEGRPVIYHLSFQSNSFSIEKIFNILSLVLKEAELACWYLANILRLFTVGKTTNAKWLIITSDTITVLLFMLCILSYVHWIGVWSTAI